jgi:hypothetical protein
MLARARDADFFRFFFGWNVGVKWFLSCFSKKWHRFCSFIASFPNLILLRRWMRDSCSAACRMSTGRVSRCPRSDLKREYLLKFKIICKIFQKKIYEWQMIEEAFI